MAHRYGHPLPDIETADTADTEGSTEAALPTSFTWRGTAYRVQSILASWHLRDRWWEAGQEATEDGPSAPRHRPSDRTYYRVLCTGALGSGIFELYRDATDGRWVLDRALD